jgi:myo-inositol-1(or 4)-monophosphatase
MQPTLTFIEEIAREAGAVLRAGYRTNYKVRHKAEKDLVTEIDEQAEALIIARIQQSFPDHKIIAEESGLTDGAGEDCWYIDPLDGTLNYAHGLPNFSVSIAYAYKGESQLGLVYDPMLNACYTAQRGQGAWLNGEPIRVSQQTELEESLLVASISREPGGNDGPSSSIGLFAAFNERGQSARRFGGAALNQCFVAAGQAEGYWVKRLQPWDVAAGTLIAREAGALVTDLHGNADYFKPPYCLLIANPTLHGVMLEVLREQGV